jgi:Asp-tRNA(Asn)/Glu-tRNA(Gln) amidotransferase A subunit family amidase
MHPRGTRNPHDPAHTPGGSSSGSAAAVGAGMIPLAIGSQTNGSVIRPASFCGIVGYKPTFGMIPRTGVLGQCRPLDTIGVFGRSVVDVALLADALAGHDPGDPDTHPSRSPDLLADALIDLPTPPKLAFVEGPAWDRAEPETQRAFATLADSLGNCVKAALPDAFAESAAVMHALTHVGFARNYGTYYERGADRLSPFMRDAIEQGRRIPDTEHRAALERQAQMREALGTMFDEYDTIVTPAATGEAPRDLSQTGDPAFCSPWSLCGVPAISLPLLTGPHGLPVGVQLVGRAGADRSLLQTARWFRAAFTDATG